jgi:hypothetical protein
MATNNQATNKTAAGVTGAAREHSFLRDDFPSIQRATLTFALCAVIGIALVISTQTMLDKQLDMFNRAQALQNSSREQYRQAENEKRQILDYQARYLQLTTQQFVGPELRLNWIEAIQSTQKAAALQPLDYEIAPQQTFLVDPSIDMGTLELRGSKMTVTMNLLHEMELFRFLNGLQARQLFDLQSCDLKRNDSSNAEHLVPLLVAECSLVWITTGKAGGDATETPAPDNVPLPAARP